MPLECAEDVFRNLKIQRNAAFGYTAFRIFMWFEKSFLCRCWDCFSKMNQSMQEHLLFIFRGVCYSPNIILMPFFPFVFSGL
ncbi:hypothetical protein ALPO108162_07645 [Alicyclobacillus pomorum]